MKRKWIKYTVRIAGVCAGIWIILLLVGYIYIKTNKNKIASLIKTNIEKRTNTKVAFTDLSVDFFHNFPGISADLQNVSLQSETSGSVNKKLLEVKNIYFGFSFFDLLSSRKTPRYITLVDGNIYFFKDASGTPNWNFKKQPDNKNRFSLRKFSFKNINAVFRDDRKNKFYNVWFSKMKCTIHDNGNEVQFEMNNNALIKSAFFNTHAGSYLSNKKLNCKWNINYDKKSKRVWFYNQLMKVNNHSYLLTGNFFVSGNHFFNLKIETNNLPLKEAASLFPLKTGKKLNQFKLSKSFYKVNAYLSGQMEYSRFPTVQVNFSVRNASLEIPNAQFEHCSFNAFFNNKNNLLRPPDDYNSAVTFTHVIGEWEKNHFDGDSVLVFNLIYPYLECKAHFTFKLERLKNIIASKRLSFNSGNGEAEVDFAGPLTKADTTYRLNGRVTISDGDISYNPRRLNFLKTNMELYLRNGDMLIKKMNTNLNSNKIIITGEVKNFLNFFNSDSSKAVFEWNLYSPLLDVTRLKSSLHRNIADKNTAGYSFFKGLNNKIDKLFDDCDAYLHTKIEKLIYKNFSANNVDGKLTLTDNIIRLDGFSLSHAEGSVMINASLKDDGSNSDLALQANIKNVKIRPLFFAFNNFGLQSLTSKNIEGDFSANINLTSALNANADLYEPASKGFIKFTLQNGRLKNFEPLMQINNNFLQKRDLSNISFAELNGQFDINGNDIKVNRMEVRSTAINMYVEGIYSFADNTNLLIQIPLHGQKNDRPDRLQNKGNNSKGGLSVFLRAKDGKDGKLKIGYDLLGRFRNKK
jgi:hypothetical protein